MNLLQTLTAKVDAKSGPWDPEINSELCAKLPDAQPPRVINEVELKKGYFISIYYQGGCVKAGGDYCCVDAMGYTGSQTTGDGPFCAVPRYQHPAFLMQLMGSFAYENGKVIGHPFLIGNYIENVIVPGEENETVYLQLGFNDGKYSDNSGFVTVDIKVYEI